ncbi:phytase [Arenimonas fontis]|uniref:Phytase n=1 Tax=Arenimonas fontis TaxID=2608255 RepID=A0A5B2ZCB6_9GAMM|nr:phytase [Arenimonas fontis]KAA2285193.1 phytase [Arenimonas fontis]
MNPIIRLSALTLSLGLGLGLAACGSLRDPSSKPLPKVFGATAVAVPEGFVTAPRPGDEIDSVALWRRPDGGSWVIATAKKSHTLVVYDGDDGSLVKVVGRRGRGVGEYERPNGIAVHDDLVFVVERDNHRVQVQRLPDFAPVAIIGREQLRSPYGLWLNPLPDGRLEMLVTDSFMADYRTETLPPLHELDQRVKRYQLDPRADGLAPEYLGHFGDTTEAGALRMVESIAGDPLHDRLLIAEEDLRVGTTLRVYDLAGRYSGRDIPSERFTAQAEGVALWACPDGRGYWIATDQNSDLTVFHVFDRRELGYLGSFTGRDVAMTDGIWLHQAGTRAFPDGVLYAAHNDEGVAAFDWREIARALDLSPRCR